MAYYLQRTYNDCGPIAILNALVFVGEKIGRSKYHQLLAACEPNDSYGTYPWNMTDFIRSINSFHRKPIYDKMKILKDCNAFILLYAFPFKKDDRHSDTGAHYIFVVRKDCEDKHVQFQVYNHYDPDTDTYSHITIHSTKHFVEEYFNSGIHSHRTMGLDYPQAWKIA